MCEKAKILVAGGSGYVGGRLIPRLLREGYPIKCLSRYPEKLQARNWPGVEIVKGDVLDPESLTDAFHDADIAYYLVHAMGSDGNFEERDTVSAGNFAEAARKKGLKRIIYLGGLASQDQELSSHLKSRQQVGKILRESQVPVTELRASIIIGSGSASFEIIRDLVKKLPVMVTPRWVKSRCEPIAIENVIDYLVKILNEPRTENQILEIGGGEVLTYQKMMRQLADVMGKKNYIIPVPVLTPKLSAYWLNLVTTVPMSIAFPLVEGLRNDSICTDRRIRDWIPIRLLSYREALDNALRHEKESSIESRWTEASQKSDDNSDSKTIRILSDRRIIESNHNPEQIFRTVQKIGGKTGWYYANWAWQLRGILDRLIGGVGMRRGRRHPVDVRAGDAIDFWRVEKFIPDQLMRLKAEMRLPGTAWLEFKVEKNSDQKSKFFQTANFRPTGLWGILYWYLMFPAHFFIFRNMAKRIVENAAHE